MTRQTLTRGRILDRGALDLHFQSRFSELKGVGQCVRLSVVKGLTTGALVATIVYTRCHRPGDVLFLDEVLKELAWLGVKFQTFESRCHSV